MSTHCLEPMTEDEMYALEFSPEELCEEPAAEEPEVDRAGSFANEELLQTWVAHHLMIIGEACRALWADFRTTHPAEVRALAAGLRNVIVHEYFEPSGQSPY